MSAESIHNPQRRRGTGERTCRMLGEDPLETMRRNLKRAMRDAGLRLWEAPHLPVPDPLAMPLAEERMRFRRLQDGACRGLLGAAAGICGRRPVLGLQGGGYVALRPVLGVGYVLRASVADVRPTPTRGALMPPLSFKKMFRSRVEDRSKRHGIRGKRRRPRKVGDKLALYTGVRTKACSLTFRTVVTKVQDVQLNTSLVAGVCLLTALIEGEITLSRLEVKALAKPDDFESADARLQFWLDNTLPFHGDIIHWKFPGDVR